MDKDRIALDFLKLYFETHPEKVPDDPDKAYDVFQKVLKKYKSKVLGDFKQKSEKYVDRFFDNKDNKYY